MLICLATLAMAVGVSFASTIPQEVESTTFNGETPQVCQFSLSKYTGTISGGYTGSFKVRVSCPSDDTLRATVGVFIDRELIASEVVEIQSGKTESGSINITVGADYDGKKFNLVVE